MVTPRFFSVFLSALLLLGCSQPEADHSAGQGSSREYVVQSVLWFQTAAEARALQYQAFNLARIRLDEDLRQASKSTKRRAIIVDVDETVLDNSVYEGRMIKENKNYPTDWNEWIDRAEAKSIAGAVEFLQYAATKGVDVFYVTNRALRDKAGTLKNLYSEGFPQAIESHLLLKIEGSSKESRRSTISETHRIVLLIGDNLNDFHRVFEKRALGARTVLVDSLKSEFGSKFIVLPNPVYGDWEDAVYEYERGLASEEKRQRRLAVLRSF